MFHNRAGREAWFLVPHDETGKVCIRRGKTQDPDLDDHVLAKSAKYPKTVSACFCYILKASTPPRMGDINAVWLPLVGSSAILNSKHYMIEQNM